MEWITEQLNTMGNGFLEYAVPMQIESAVLVGLALVLVFALRKTVRPSVRYWLVTCVLVFVVLSPLFSLCSPSNCLPTSSAAYADPTTHTAAERASRSQTTAIEGPEYTRDPLARPRTGQSGTSEVGTGEGDPQARSIAFGGPPSRPHLTWQGAVLLVWPTRTPGIAAVWPTSPTSPNNPSLAWA